MGTESKERVEYKKQWYKEQKLKHPEKFMKESKRFGDIAKPEVVQKTAMEVTDSLRLDDQEEDMLILGELYNVNSPYTPEDKIKACTAYIVTGKATKAQKLCGVTADTIRQWKNKAHWWPDLVQLLRKQKQDEMDGSITGILHQAIDIVGERLTHGEEVVLKDGTVVHKMPSMKDVVWALGVLFDKRQLLRGEATSRTEKVSTSETLNTIKKQFEEMAAQLNAKTIDGEVIK